MPFLTSYLVIVRLSFVFCFLFLFHFFFLRQMKVLDFVNVEQFQYGNPDILCLPLVAAHTPGQDLVVLTISPHSCYFPLLSGFVSPVLNPLGVLKTMGAFIRDTWHFVRTPNKYWSNVFSIILSPYLAHSIKRGRGNKVECNKGDWICVVHIWV